MSKRFVVLAEESQQVAEVLEQVAVASQEVLLEMMEAVEKKKYPLSESSICLMSEKKTMLVAYA